MANPIIDKSKIIMTMNVDETGTASGGGGGGGDASAANQLTEISLLTDIKAAAIDTTAIAVTGPLTDTQLRATAVPVSGPATDTQLRATPLPVSGSTAHDSAAGTLTNLKPELIGGVASDTPTSVGDLDIVTARFARNGNFMVSIGHPSASSFATLTGVGRGVSLPGANGLFVASGTMTYNGSTHDSLIKPSAASRILSSGASTNATSAKASAGEVFTITGNNTSGSIKYLKFYNKASAPTVGTDTPVLTLALPTGQFQINMPGIGFYFATGIAYALTGASADADTTALAAGDIVGLNIIYA